MSLVRVDVLRLGELPNLCNTPGQPAFSIPADQYPFPKNDSTLVIAALGGCEHVHPREWRRVFADTLNAVFVANNVCEFILDNKAYHRITIIDPAAPGAFFGSSGAKQVVFEAQAAMFDAAQAFVFAFDHLARPETLAELVKTRRAKYRDRPMFCVKSGFSPCNTREVISQHASDVATTYAHDITSWTLGVKLAQVFVERIRVPDLPGVNLTAIQPSGLGVSDDEFDRARNGYSLSRISITTIQDPGLDSLLRNAPRSDLEYVQSVYLSNNKLDVLKLSNLLAAMDKRKDVYFVVGMGEKYVRPHMMLSYMREVGHKRTLIVQPKVDDWCVQDQIEEAVMGIIGLRSNGRVPIIPELPSEMPDPFMQTLGKRIKENPDLRAAIKGLCDEA